MILSKKFQKLAVFTLKWCGWVRILEMLVFSRYNGRGWSKFRKNRYSGFKVVGGGKNFEEKYYFRFKTVGAVKISKKLMFSL